MLPWMSEAFEVSVVGLEALPDCHHIRRVVFVAGQQVPEALEIDGLDDDCVHFLARDRSGPIGTARLRVVDGLAKAERVAVLETSRGSGVGAELMHALEMRAQRDGLTQVLLHAQQTVIPFYRKLGYREEGELFDEAGIVHQTMRKQLL